MTGPAPAWDPWTDQSYLRESQYKTDVNLAARQSIYAYQEPPVDLARETLALAGLDGWETVADIGCGNGRYLAGLTRRGHTGAVLGVDMSPGMLIAARDRMASDGDQAQQAGDRAPQASDRAPQASDRAPQASDPAARIGLLVADAMALPVSDASADVTLAMHMLYHVPEPERAVRELRRITRPGGRVIVGLNGADHLRELRDLIAESLASLGRPPVRSREQLGLDDGERLLSSQFASVTRHDFESQLRVPAAEPVAAYVRSRVPDAGPLAAAVLSKLPADPALFPITTHSGCLVCT